MSTGQILIVDDIAANAVALEAALEPLQRRIVTALSGQQALGRLLEDDFSLVLLDVQMPDMDGYETAQWIRRRERTRHVPIIFTTAYSYDDLDVRKAYALGAVDFLFKPIVPEVLRAKASVFVTLQERTEQLAAERMERQFEHRANEKLARLNEALARANAELAAGDRAKDAFLAILAHELRNPLSPLRTCVDLMRDDADRRLTEKMFGVLDRQVGILGRLVDDLLDLSRIKADKIELRLREVDLVDVLETALTTSRPLIEKGGHTVTVDVTAERIAVVADAVRVTQVVANLLNNAARYTPRGGQIRLSAGIDGARAVVRVADNGIGIPTELQGSIFDMFVQERVGPDGSGGLGLGLALARRLVEMHRGVLSVHSDGRGTGSMFELALPLAGTAAALEPNEESAPSAAVPLEADIRIAIVDDNADAREMLADLLRDRGLRAVAAPDGPSGFDLIAAERPHVALVDIGLPGMDGIALIEKLRAVYPDLPTRLVALTGYGGGPNRDRIQQAGFHAHLVKPAKASEILDCIAQQLGPR